MGSTATRQAEGTIYTHAGPEIGVASTKAFTTQLAVLHPAGPEAGRGRGHRGPPSSRRELLQGLRELPAHLERPRQPGAPDRSSRAQRWQDATDFLYLGRGSCYPIALEGA